MSIFGGDDQLLKSVRITDSIKVEVYQQGKRRKYALFYDSQNPKINNIRRNNDNTKSKKYDVSLTDDQVIEEALKSYNDQFSDGRTVYKVEQDPYKEVPKRIYGSSETPYYLNNGCKMTIEWFGYKPNPFFSLGTSSTAKEAEEFNKSQFALDSSKRYIPRWLKDVNITSDYDVTELYSMAPFSTWIVPTGEINQSSLKMIPNYRDSSQVTKKQITIYMPEGFTENGGVGYIIWSDKGELEYWGGKRDNDNFSLSNDEDIVSQVIQKFKSMVTKLHGISDYDLKLCSIDTEYCKLIDYKSPLEAPNNTPQQAAINDTPPGPSHSNTKIKLNILGLFDGGGAVGITSSFFEIKAKTNMPTFTVWTGEVPKTEEIDVFDDLSELDPEYIETDFQGDGENINTLEEVKFNIEEANSSTVVSTNSPPQGTPPQGNYNVENIEPDTTFDVSKLPIPPGFNGVPLYFQYDNRWANYNYGVGKKMTCSGKGAGTISSSGCMPSSLSMIINYWAKKGYCKPTRPDVVGQFCVDYGGRVCGNGGNLTLIPKDKFKEVFGLNIVAFGNIGDDKVRTLLKKGFPVNHGGKTNGKTAKGGSKSYGGHYLVMTGIDEQGRIRVNDSGNGPMGGKAITYYDSDKWSSANVTATSQSYLYPDALGDPLK